MKPPFSPPHQAASDAARKPLRRASQLLPLEPRFMFDGALVADAAHAAQAQAQEAVAEAAIPPALQARAAALAVAPDTTAPAIASVAVPVNGSYGAGATLSFSVLTDEAVYVDSSGGIPRLQLTIGSTTRYASYVSGSGSSTLVFSYQVQAGETDSDGIAVNAFSANGGSITDAAGNALTSALNGLASTAGVLVDTTAPATSSVSVPANATYYAGDALEFTVNFNEAVTVNTSGGTPRLALVVGVTTRYATYVSGSGSTALTFRYTVANGETDSNGIAVGNLNANGGTLRDAAGNNATLTLNSVGSTANVLVDGAQPAVTMVSASTANGSYGAANTINITLTFNSAVDVDTTGGVPTLALNSGGIATYLGGSGGNTLSFSYTVGAGENSADLDYSGSAALALNGAAIHESGNAGRNASVTLMAPGAAGSLGANRNLVIDTLAPTITGGSLVFADDSGASATDLITNQAAQTEIHGTLSGAPGSGESVQVSLDNGLSWIVATTVGTNWSIGARTLAGSDTAQVRVVDAAGNIGPAASFAYVLDQSGPATTFGGIGFSDDSGISNADLDTNVAAQTISATLSSAPAVGEKVLGSLDGGATWTDITSQVSGTTLTWNVTLAGAGTLQFYVRDVAGNDGAITSQAYVLDTTPPTTSVASMQFSNDSGASSSDFITNVASQTVSGTLSANLAAGELVYVSVDNGASWQQATATVGADTWALAGVTLTASSTLQVKVSDAAGNDGPVISQGYTFDTTPPPAATVMPVTTTSLTPVLSGGATLAAGDSLTVTVGGATYDVTPVAGAWTLDLATAVPSSGALTLVLNTRYEVTAIVTDAAGNSSVDASSGELTVGSLVPPPTTPDPTPPTPTPTPPTTSASGATLSSDTGISGSDFITNVAAQTISGSLSAPLLDGESVQVSLDGGASWRNAAVSGTSWSFGATLSGGSTLQVHVSNEAGSGPVYSQAYTLDTTPPAVPVADAIVASSLTPVLSGGATLAEGETLTVSVGGAEYAVGIANGRWTLDLANATPSSGSLSLAIGGSYTVQVTVTDLAGNRSSGSATLNVATLPQISGLALSADTGASASDFITSVATQTLSGTLSAPLVAGQSVEVSADGGVTWRGATASGNSWSASVTLSDSNTLLARVTSAAGAGMEIRQAYVLDSVAPAATPVLTALTSDGGVTGTLSAPLDAGETLLASSDGGGTWTAVAVSGNSWSLPAGGTGGVQLLVRDTAGNNGAVLLVDTTVPPVQPPIQPDQAQHAVAPTTLTPPAMPIAGTDAATGASFGQGGAVVGAPVAGAPVAPQVLPLTGIGGDIATSWPGQRPPTVLDAMPGYIALQPLRASEGVDDSFSIITLPDLPNGAALVAYNPIPDVRGVTGERISVQVGSDAFAHSSNARVELSAQSADGTPLPGWLRFDTRTARFEGTPPAGFEGTLNFRVIARDSQGRVATQVFKIVIGKDGARTSQQHAEPVGRPSLGEQMRDVRSAASARLVALAT